MGFKADCIFVSEREPGFFGTQPKHQVEQVEPVLGKLGFPLRRRAGTTDLCDSVFPEPGLTAIGCFDRALFLADQERVSGAVEWPEKRPLLQAVLRCFPQATVMVMSLHSVSNYFAYSLYERGSRIRAHGGCAGEPDMEWEEGPPLPEEAPHYAKSFLRDGQRFFLAEVTGKEEEFDSASYGESLAFAVISRFLGKPFDHFLDRIDVEAVQLQSPKPWWCFW